MRVVMTPNPTEETTMSNQQASRLTVPPAKEQTKASRPLNGMTGIGVPKTSGMNGRDDCGFFVPLALVRSMADRGGELKSSPMLVSVRQPKPVRHPIGVGGRGNTRLRAKPMATTLHGAIRQNSTQTINADGTVSTVTWVRQATVIKRVRRHLAKRKHALLISSEGTQTRDEYGQYAVIGVDGIPLQKNADLVSLSRYLGVLAADEMVEPPAEAGWRFHVARKHSEVIDGRAVKWLERLSRDFRTERAARKALEAIEDRVGLCVIGDDSRDDSVETMAKTWEREQQARHQAAMKGIGDGIDANPTLRHLRSEAGCPQAWGAAVAFDLQLQKDPAWSGKPVADRLNQVVALLQQHGLVASESEVPAHVE